MKSTYLWKNCIGLIAIILFSIGTEGCSHSSGYSSDGDVFDDFGGYDGEYCADVEYYNPNTGTQSTYRLNIYVEDDELIEIYWPSGGWLDQDHFWSTDISDGTCSFTSDQGYDYSVTIIGDACGWTDEASLGDQWEADRESLICSRCGGEKSSHDEYCYSCEEDIEDEEENTCGRCGSYEYGVFRGLCSSCLAEYDGDNW